MGLNEDIISKLKLRQEDGLRLLYANYSDTLFGIAFRVLKSEPFAEDALQQSFLKIWKSIDKYESDKSTLFTWMAKIVRNTAIDITRLKSFQKENKTETLKPTVSNNKTETINTDAIDVKSLLDGIEDKYSTILDYLYLQGYSQRELAKKIDLPLGTIKTRCKKAIDILREKLKDENKLLLGGFILIILIIKLLLS